MEQLYEVEAGNYDQFGNKTEETENTKAKPKLDLPVAVCFVATLIFILALILTSTPAPPPVPINELPRPHSQAVLNHFCQQTPTVKP